MHAATMTIAQAARAESRRRARPAPAVYSCFKSDFYPSVGKPRRGAWRHNLTTDAAGATGRRDWQATAMGDASSQQTANNGGFATATTATTLTAATGFPTTGQALKGRVVFAGPNNAGAGSAVWAVIVSNTATVLTVDQWYSATSSTLAAGTTPNATCAFVVGPGQAPAQFLAVTANGTAPTTADTTLTAEITTSDFIRAVGTYAHTTNTTTYTLTKLFTSTTTVTINKEAVFGACNTTGGGAMPFESAEPSPPTLVSGDTLSQVVTITIN